MCHAILLFMHEFKRPYRSTRHIATLLSPITGKALGRRGFAEQQLLVLWRDIVGAEHARYSIPLRLRRGRNNKGGTLKIRAESGIALLMQHDAPRIIERINRDSGYELVARLEFVQAPLPETPVSTGTSVISTPKRMSPVPSEKPPFVPDIDHPPLRKALQRLAESLASR